MFIPVSNNKTYSDLNWRISSIFYIQFIIHGKQQRVLFFTLSIHFWKFCKYFVNILFYKTHPLDIIMGTSRFCTGLFNILRRYKWAKKGLWYQSVHWDIVSMVLDYETMKLCFWTKHPKFDGQSRFWSIYSRKVKYFIYQVIFSVLLWKLLFFYNLLFNEWIKY